VSAIWSGAGRTDGVVNEPHCHPDSRQAEIIGNEVAMDSAQQRGGWLLPNLIDLGDLPANQAVKLPLTITIPAPAHLTEELVGLQLSPNQLPTAGQHFIQLTLAADKLARDTMLAGQVIIRTANETRAIWVIGRVTDQTARSYDKLLLVNPSGHKYAFGATTVLGQAQFIHELGAAQLTPQQAQLRHEPQGAWTIIQPLPVTVATRIDGQILGIGHRRLLKTGELIELGPLKLTVETQQTDLPLIVPSELDLGKVSPNPKLHYLTIENNRKVSLWRGTLRSTVDWLIVPSSHISCLGGQTSQIPLQLSPAAQALPPQKLHQLGALVLSGMNESWFINVRLEIEELTPKISLEPTMLDWGEVSAWQQSQPQTIRLHNAGLKTWTGRITAHVPWLEVRPSQLVCPPQSEVTTQVYLTQAVENLAFGQTKTAAALSLSDGSNTTISLMARLTRTPSQLEVIPAQVALTVSNNTSMPRTVIRVRNMGAQPWSGTVRSTLPWLEVAPSQLICQPHREAPIEIWLNSQANRVFSQPRAPLQIDDALEITGMGLLLKVGCRVTANFTLPSIPPLTQGGAGGGSLSQGGQKHSAPIETTKFSLTIDKLALDFGTIQANRSFVALPTQTVQITNSSATQPISLTIRSTVPWLTVATDNLICLPQQTMSLLVQMTSAARALPAKIYDVPDVLVIQSGEQKMLLSARVEVTR